MGKIARGKSSDQTLLQSERQHAQTNPKKTSALKSFSSTIFAADCLDILRQIPSETIDLVYLDPPFFSNRRFEMLNRERKESAGFDDRWRNGIWQYLAWVNERVRECHRVLRKTGSLYLHCDWHASHYLKVELDIVFGSNKFVNEVIWKRHNSHNNSKQGSKCLGKVHDTILHYSKSKTSTWNMIYKSYDPDYVRKYYRHMEHGTGRRYALGDLSGPGGGGKSNPYYTFKGVTRHWRYSEETMTELDQQDRIVQKRPGNVPVLKRYLDEMKGIPLQDIWDDIPPIYPASKEWQRYPTQKPLELLKRIIALSTNPNDVVLDPFCGAGSSLIAASSLQRKWIGIDSNRDACKISLRRLRKEGIDADFRRGQAILSP